MQRKIRKKAAISLSTNAMVIIILSLVTIGLMIPFLGKITEHSDSFIDYNQNRLDEFLRKANCKGSEDFCVYPNVINPLVREERISAALVNNLDFGVDEPVRFKVNYTIIPISGEPNECVKILPPNNYNFSMYPSSKIGLNFILRPNGSGNCLLKINIFYYLESSGWQDYRTANVYIYKN